MASLFLLRRERRPAFYELYDGQVRLASMRYAYTRERAVVANSADGGWEMRRPRVFGSELPVLAVGGRREVGLVRQRIWRGGADFELDGIRYELRGTSIVRRTWALTAVGGETLHLTMSRTIARRLGPIALDHVPAVMLAFHLMMLPMRVKPRSAAAGHLPRPAGG